MHRSGQRAELMDDQRAGELAEEEAGGPGAHPAAAMLERIFRLRPGDERGDGHAGAGLLDGEHGERGTVIRQRAHQRQPGPEQEERQSELARIGGVAQHPEDIGADDDEERGQRSELAERVGGDDTGFLEQQPAIYDKNIVERGHQEGDGTSECHSRPWKRRHGAAAGKLGRSGAVLLRFIEQSAGGKENREANHVDEEGTVPHQLGDGAGRKNNKN